jgi:hypothetical protein
MKISLYIFNVSSNLIKLMKQLKIIGIIYLLIPWRLEFYIFHLFYIGLLQTMNNNLQRLERLVFYIYANLVNN